MPKFTNLGTDGVGSVKSASHMLFVFGTDGVGSVKSRMLFVIGTDGEGTVKSASHMLVRL
jgi:hypothetical protein